MLKVYLMQLKKVQEGPKKFHNAKKIQEGSRILMKIQEYPRSCRGSKVQKGSKSFKKGFKNIIIVQKCVRRFNNVQED